MDCLQDMLTTHGKALISVAQSSTALKPEILAMEFAAIDSAKSAEKRRGLCSLIFCCYFHQCSSDGANFLGKLLTFVYSGSRTNRSDFKTSMFCYKNTYSCNAATWGRRCNTPRLRSAITLCFLVSIFGAQ